jgi:hypothetical protein
MRARNAAGRGDDDRAGELLLGDSAWLMLKFDPLRFDSERSTLTGEGF